MIFYLIINGIFFVPIELLKLLILTIFQLPLIFVFKGRFRQFVKNQYITIDQNVNVLCGGACDETISSRIYKVRNTNKVAMFLVRFLNFFEKDHCKLSEETNIIDDSVI